MVTNNIKGEAQQDEGHIMEVLNYNHDGFVWGHGNYTYIRCWLGENEKQKNLTFMFTLIDGELLARKRYNANTKYANFLFMLIRQTSKAINTWKRIRHGNLWNEEWNEYIILGNQLTFEWKREDEEVDVFTMRIKIICRKRIAYRVVKANVKLAQICMCCT